jgi:NAD(P)-dependent dehydrogenase (short-subunit alcohol dehydrogenase family)
MNEVNDGRRLKDKVAVLTGGGGILGSRFALALVTAGAKVAVVDRYLDKAEEVVERVNSINYGSALAFGVDITNTRQMDDLQSRVACDLGDVDILINNAATKSDNFFEPFESFSISEWNEVMAVNTTGAMIGCQKFGGHMAKRGAGSIINVLSVYGIIAPDQRIYENAIYEGKHINTPAVYSTSKAALWGLTKYLASYWGHCGLRVNAISPGGVFSGQNDDFVTKYSERVPLQRMADKDEMCGAMVFLSSDDSTYITGQNIVVDGGLTVW